MKPFYAPEAQGDAVWALVGSPIGLLAVYLIAVMQPVFVLLGSHL